MHSEPHQSRRTQQIMAECPGLYRHAEAADGRLARIRIPGGRLEASAARAIGEAAQALGNGVVELTSRANLQVRGLGADAADKLPECLAGFGLCPADREADRRRNVLADPLAGIDPDEVTDISPLLVAFDKALGGSHPDLDGLSPKVSFVLDGGGRSASLAFAHDVGLRAERNAGKMLFRISLAGRPSRFGVPPEHAVAVLMAIAGVLARIGRDARGSTLDSRDLVGLIRRTTGIEPADLPACEPSPEPPSFVGRHGTGTHCALGLAAPVGSLAAADFVALADLAIAFGDGGLRLSPRRSVLLTGVTAEKITAVEREAERIGFLTRPRWVTVIACSGRACARGRADARRDGAHLATVLAAVPQQDNRRSVVHVSGCRRGCAYSAAADVTFVAQPGGVYDLHRSARADASGRPIRRGLGCSDLPGETTRALLASHPAPAAEHVTP